jgi:hypothetical protein
MRYMGTPSTPQIRDAMTRGLIDTMTGPYQGNILPPHAVWGADNGKFTKDGPRGNWLGHERWYRWLTRQAERYGPDLCRFAVAPDVPFDAAGTLRESGPWLARIRALGLPAAFAAQDGCERLGVPWDEVDVLFLAGSDRFKTGPDAQRLATTAKERGKWVHMGRVNSNRRLTIARTYGCDSVDGTYLKFGPDINLPRLLGWLADARHRPMLIEAAAQPPDQVHHHSQEHPR